MWQDWDTTHTKIRTTPGLRLGYVMRLENPKTKVGAGKRNLRAKRHSFSTPLCLIKTSLDNFDSRTRFSIKFQYRPCPTHYKYNQLTTITLPEETRLGRGSGKINKMSLSRQMSNIKE